MFSLFKGKPKNTPKNTPTSKSTSIVQNSKPKIVSLIFSHNSRMQCFMERFKIPRNNDKEKIRFKNGAIIKLVVENNRITPSLVYEGELDEKETKKIVKKGAYYTKNTNTKNKNVKNLKSKVGNDVNLSDRFKIFSDFFEPNSLNILEHLTKKTVELDPTQKYEFYIIRHGQGIHNGVELSKKILFGSYYKDAILTATGKEQASRSGEALNKILGDSKVNYLFATDLRRTRETLVEVLGKLTNQLNLKNPKIIILPCSHEISVEKNKGDKSCDEAEASKLERMAVENFPVCVFGRSMKGTIGFDNSKKAGCGYQNSYYIDWSYYLAFYNNTMRGIYSRSWSRLRCRDTNMIIEALNIIKNGPEVIQQYKRNIGKIGNNYSPISQTNNNKSNTLSTTSISTSTSTPNQVKLSNNNLINKYIDNNGKLKVNISNLKNKATLTEKTKLNEISSKRTLTEANLRTIHTITTNMEKRGIKLEELLQGAEKMKNAASNFSKAAKQLKNQQKKSLFSRMRGTSKK